LGAVAKHAQLLTPLSLFVNKLGFCLKISVLVSPKIPAFGQVQA
jgi:hypothetical protein